ncbi:MAG: sigma-70 family RNA polymerase sigma factor [Oscillospiraceae bacterium]|nr:sigma-70 family RNA polymerase sigma factor [Oscillospiraceae bacterium]
MDKFEELYNEYFPRVYSFLYKLCKDSMLTEELTQETFYQAFKSFHRFRGKSEIFTWLAAIAKHTYYKYLKKNKLGLDAISIDLVTDFYRANTLGNPQEDLQKKFVTESIQTIVGKIPEKYRDVVMLRIYAEMPFSQVALALGISESSAKVIYFRAKKKLMEELNDEFDM